MMALGALESALLSVPEHWFVYALGEEVTPILRRGDRHDPIRWYCELQHRQGGLLTKGRGLTAAQAVTRTVAALPLERARELGKMS